MRSCHYDFGWVYDVTTDGSGDEATSKDLSDDERVPIGLSLGNDQCSQHWDNNYRAMLSSMGADVEKAVDQPLGMNDRKIVRSPKMIHFEVFKQKQVDGRKKSFDVGILVVSRLRPPMGEYESRLAELKKITRVADPNQARQNPNDFMCTAWSDEGFAVAMRGDCNIEKLRQIHEAFLMGDIAVPTYDIPGFARKKEGLVVLSRLSDVVKKTVLKSDSDAKLLREAALATGIENELKKAGKRWHALGAGWRDKARGQVHFFLNPDNQKSNNHGWFTPAELRRWIVNDGPVIADPELNEVDRLGGPFEAFKFELLRAMSAAGANQVRHPRLSWLNDKCKILGQEMALKLAPGAPVEDRWESFSDLSKRFLGKDVDVMTLIQESRELKDKKLQAQTKSLLRP